MTPAPRDPARLLPLSPAMFHVLAALAESPRHGYAIIKDVLERTQGRVALSTGTLYGLVKRLRAEGLIVESAHRPTASDGDDERRRYYRLTDFGRAVAVAEAQRLEQMVVVARASSLLKGRQRA